MPHHRRVFLIAHVVALVLGSLLLAACTGPKTSPFQREEFESNRTYSRSIPAGPGQTCEAARRALLSQGYVVLTANAELVNARKSFQPESDNHVEIDFRVVCAAEKRGDGESTLAFVTALQDRFALKKSNNSASVGVGAIGSLSLPFTSSDDSMVKVASETITAAAFYDRYFRLLKEYLVAVEPVAPVPPVVPIAPVTPVTPVTPTAPVTPVTPTAPVAPVAPPAPPLPVVPPVAAASSAAAAASAAASAPP